jgi:hypothetical protein
MIKFLLKQYTKIIFWLFIVGLYLVVFVRDSIDNEILILIINYYFWFIFGFACGVFLSNIINKAYNKLNDRPKP